MLERLESEVLDTVKGLTSLLADFPPSVRLVVWLNEFFGPIVNAQGKPFEEMPAYTDVSPDESASNPVLMAMGFPRCHRNPVFGVPTKEVSTSRLGLARHRLRTARTGRLSALAKWVRREYWSSQFRQERGGNKP